MDDHGILWDPQNVIETRRDGAIVAQIANLLCSGLAIRRGAKTSRPPRTSDALPNRMPAISQHEVGS
jgi:hypothetical protein